MNTVTTLLARGRTVVRDGWDDGPWDDEDDRYEGHVIGYPAVIWRHPSHGQLNGYLAVTDSHPWWGNTEHEVEVHGGITYAGMPDEGDWAHLPHPDGINVWWLGFDCHHMWDIAPGFDAREMRRQYPDFPELRYPIARSYKTVAYVTGQLEDLATQANMAL